jgi:hypothetical protein
VLDDKGNETRKRIKSAFEAGNGIRCYGISQAASRREVLLRRPMGWTVMPKKSPSGTQENQEEPRLSLGRDIPQAAPVDDAAFGRRAGEIIARASASLHKPKGTGSDKRMRRSE